MKNDLNSAYPNIGQDNYQDNRPRYSTRDLHSNIK